MNPSRFAIVGGGWRADFYLRVAAALPERFDVTGLLTRDVGRRVGIGQTFAVPTPESLDDLLSTGPDYVVIATPWSVTPELIRELTAARGLNVSRSRRSVSLAACRSAMSMSQELACTW